MKFCIDVTVIVKGFSLIMDDVTLQKSSRLQILWAILL